MSYRLPLGFLAALFGAVWVTGGCSLRPADAQSCSADPVDSTVWPNSQSCINSDPWISAHHAQLRNLSPRFLVINFANCLGAGGGDNCNGGTLDANGVQTKAQQFITMLSKASTYQPRLNPTAQPFLTPKIVKVVNLQDSNGHANSDAFPRGPLNPSSGYPEVGYYQLFTTAYAKYWGFQDSEGNYLTLEQLVSQGTVHEIIMMANQVDGNGSNPGDQVTNDILEVAMVAQAYDANLSPIPGGFVKNGIAHDRQTADMSQATGSDDNSMPWFGRSLRIYFMNASRGAGCLLHSLGHEFEFRYNQSQIYAPGTNYDGASQNPWMQPYFRKFADFDLDTKYGAQIQSLYADDTGSTPGYTYSGCDAAETCTLNYPAQGSVTGGSISGFVPACGDVHYPPGASEGYDYTPATTLPSICETFQKKDESPQPFNFHNWDYVTNDPTIDGDCGGYFLTYWYQNMPGYQNEALDSTGAAMRNWWPFMYY